MISVSINFEKGDFVKNLIFGLFFFVGLLYSEGVRNEEQMLFLFVKSEINSEITQKKEKFNELYQDSRAGSVDWRETLNSSGILLCSPGGENKDASGIPTVECYTLKVESSKVFGANSKEYKTLMSSLDASSVSRGLGGFLEAVAASAAVQVAPAVGTAVGEWVAENIDQKPSRPPHTPAPPTPLPNPIQAGPSGGHIVHRDYKD